MKSSRATERAQSELARRIASTAPALLIGSFAVHQLAPELLRRVPRDVDFLVSVPSLIRIVENIPIEWTSWNEPLVLGETPLQGRFYIRGRHNDLHVDLTYESRLDWSAAWSQRIERAGLTIASPRDLACLYEARNRQGDIELAAQLKAIRSTRTWQGAPCQIAESQW